MLFPPGSLPDNPTLDTKKALLLLDFQHDFVNPNGKLCAPTISTFVDKLPELANRFRESGPVVWVRTEYAEPCPVFSPETGGFSILLKQFIKGLSETHDECSSDHGNTQKQEADDQAAEPVMESDPEAFLAADISPCQRCCVPGSEGAQYPEHLRSAISRKDLVMVKTNYSAFADMSLLFQLRTRMVTTLYVCGSLSNISVYATALDAVRHGFGVTVVEDCLGYRDESCHINAMRQMADNMCVEGIDYQELMDDLLGLLGDVVDEDSFQTKFKVNLSRPTAAEKRSENARQVDKWMLGVDAATVADQGLKQDREHSVQNGHPSLPDLNSRERNGPSKNAPHTRRPSLVTESLNSSPPRKRSTNDLGDDLEVSLHVRLSHSASVRKSSYDTSHTRPESKTKKIKQRIRRVSRPAQQALDEPQPPAHPTPQSSSNTDAPEAVQEANCKISPGPCNSETTPIPTPTYEKKAKKVATVTLGPDDLIGDGTSRVAYNSISPATADRAFEELRSSNIWQKMYHRSGEVPRLVAVQGDIVTSSIDHSRTYPIYRHPADESPELRPFTPLVDMLRQECEEHVGHTLNHVLIQLYRNSEDNISEHSDKTLDIVRGSNIVNLSLGATRTMTLRSKVKRPNPATDPSSQPPPRETQRIPLPHASLFILSTASNASYLHAVRSDKRRPAEKYPDELAFNGERISLTFRHVGTYITETHDDRNLIWGQGATGKRRSDAQIVLQLPPDTAPDPTASTSAATPADHNPAASSTNPLPMPKPSPTNPHDPNTSTHPPDATLQAETMLNAFGKENHTGTDFDWDALYGGGFDIVNFVTTSAKTGSRGDAVDE